MLINKKPDANSVMLIRLTTGEEVIGRIKDSQDDNHITVTKPYMIAIQPGPDGKPVLMMMPYLMLSDETEVVFLRSAVVCQPYGANKQVSDEYIKKTSGIAVASQLPNGVPPSKLIR